MSRKWLKGVIFVPLRLVIALLMMDPPLFLFKIEANTLLWNISLPFSLCPWMWGFRAEVFHCWESWETCPYWILFLVSGIAKDDVDTASTTPRRFVWDREQGCFRGVGLGFRIVYNPITQLPYFTNYELTCPRVALGFFLYRELIDFLHIVIGIF